MVPPRDDLHRACPATPQQRELPLPIEPVDMRSSFVVVVASSAVATITATSAANPPAPTSVPDPPTLAGAGGHEHPNRLRRHDGGCFAYFDDVPLAKAPCVDALKHAGEEIDRETTSGQCVLIEPWGAEPTHHPCPAVLVPPGWKSPSLAKAIAPTQPASEPAPKTAGCARCSVTRETASVAPVLALAAIAAARRRRR